MARGVAAGDRVALLSRTRYEWTLLDYAIWYAGAVTVPIYETSSADQIAWILADSAAVLVVAETADHVGPSRVCPRTHAVAAYGALPRRWRPRQAPSWTRTRYRRRRSTPVGATSRPTRQPR